MIHNFFHDVRSGLKEKPLEPWQKKRLLSAVLAIVIIGTLYIGVTCAALIGDKASMENKWDSRFAMNEEQLAAVDARSANAIEVSCGTYLENLKEISLKNSSFRATLQAWFRWEGDETLDMAHHIRFYKGTINSREMMVDTHENGINYQLLQMDVTVSKDFMTNRFPLDSHQLNLYLESEYPIEKVRLRADAENSSMNGSLNLSGYRAMNSYVSEYCYQYDSTHGDPALSEPIMTSEVVTSLELTRDGFGLYLKCFIALFGTSLWVFITLFICTNHHVDPLGMIPAALFGSVSNIMVGANLLPDALTLGLLEYVNTWGVMTIIAGALCVISINRIRKKYEDQDFAMFFGRIMFVLLLFFVIAGHIAMPLCAYLWV